MITVRLLGGARKAVGKQAVDIDKPSVSVSEILKFLQGISAEPKLLQPNNLIVAINGVDSAALQGENTVAKSGDAVTIVTVVHGGADYFFDGNHVLVIGVNDIVHDPGKLVDRMRAENKDVSIQAINADSVYGLDHVLGIIRIALEAERRKVMLANKFETELLMRLACTDQISEAIKRAGLKQGAPGCLIALSQDNSALQQFASYVKENFVIDDTVLNTSKKKRKQLSGMLGLASSRFKDDEFLHYLLERAAILVK